MKINVYCKNKGWLFEDLKREIAEHGAVPSDSPLPDMDAYICIRDDEAKLSPQKRKTVVQIHHTNPIRHKGYGAISFVHPWQEKQYRRFSHRQKCFTQPIGTRNVPVTPFPDRPVLGYFCREVRGLKRSDLFKDAVVRAKQDTDFDVLMIGEKLDHIAHLGTYEERAATIEDYQRITAFLTTSVSPMVPLSAYEALAAGRPLITTPREFPVDFSNIFTSKNAVGLASLISMVLKGPIHAPQSFFYRSAWAQKQCLEAAKLC